MLVVDDGERYFFQRDGTVTFQSVVDSPLRSMGAIDATLEEVTFGANAFSIPVAGGDCFHITGAWSVGG